MTSIDIFDGLADGDSVRITRIRGAVILEAVGERFREVRILRRADLETDPDLLAWAIATAGRNPRELAAS